jgi:high-affinity iron transporter
MFRNFIAALALSLLFAGGLASGSLADAPPTSAEAQVAWRLLDYVAVDYPGAVQKGRVISPSEYAEMAEFSGSIAAKIKALPPTPQKPALLAQADALVGLVKAKADTAEVARAARKLAGDLLAAYPVPLAPPSVPDLARGGALYAAQCSSCHGATGHADGPAAQGLDPRPVAFADEGRASRRSAFGLYQVISQGLDGTAMPSFAAMPEKDRWALAFYVGRFAYSDADAAKGQALWQADPALRTVIPNLQALSQMTPTDLAAKVGSGKARYLVAYLRRHPEALTKDTAGSLALSKRLLGESVAAYKAGDRRKATDQALAAYLDGFEPVEVVLSARDPGLLRRVEGAMGEFRGAISSGASAADVEAKALRALALVEAAETALAPAKASTGSIFAGAFTILLREGLEALLIVVAMLAFLRKAERPDVLPYVHGGWVSALAAGGLTWVAATFFISISGASRELTEGFGSLLAAVVLVSVGIWMHGKSSADAWQKYIHEKLSQALSKQSAWFLFLLAFVVVYREVFETILFYSALWGQGGQIALLAGFVSGVVVLALVAWALLAFSRRLPIAQFFSVSSALMAVLAVVLAGKGVAALQEAGMVDLHPLAGAPRIDILGLFPTWEGVLAQLVAVLVLAAGFWFGRPGARPAKA